MIASALGAMLTVAVVVQGCVPTPEPTPTRVVSTSTTKTTTTTTAPKPTTTTAPKPTTTTTTTTTTTVPSPTTSVPDVGVQLDTTMGTLGISPGAELLSLSDSALGPRLDEIAAAGARWVRVDLPWPAVQATRTTWNWTNQDRVLNAVAAHDLRALVVIGYKPSWAVTSSGALDTAAFGTFASRASIRYRDLVDGWEIWNEPNLAGAWGGAADPVAYSRALQAAHASIDVGDPESPVLTGGLAPATNGNGNIAPVDFLRGVYNAGARNSFDAVGMHPYGYPALPDDSSTSSWNTWYRLADVRSLMDGHGDRDKLVWLTEFGAPTGTANGAVSETRQADIVESGIRLWQEMDRSGPLFMYSMRDRGTDPAEREENFGLRRHNGSAKPVLERFSAGAQALDN